MENSPLGCMPPEIRNMIYQYALTEPESTELHIQGEIRNCLRSYNTSLLQVCRATSAEAQGYRPTENGLHIYIEQHCWRSAAQSLRDWAQTTSRLRMLSQITSITAHLAIPNLGFPGWMRQDLSSIPDTPEFLDAYAEWKLVIEAIQSMALSNRKVQLVLTFQQRKDFPPFEFEFSINKISFAYRRVFDRFSSESDTHIGNMYLNDLQNSRDGCLGETCALLSAHTLDCPTTVPCELGDDHICTDLMLVVTGFTVYMMYHFMLRLREDWIQREAQHRRTAVWRLFA